MQNRNSRWMYFRGVLLVPLFVLCGCASMSKPMSASFASVDIEGATEAKIREKTLEVFRADGWQVLGGTEGEMVFEREGSKWDHVAYGSNINNEPVLNRVRASIVPLSSGSSRLQCQAFIVRDAGGMGMEDEIRLYAPRAKPYKQLLRKVAAALASAESK